MKKTWCAFAAALCAAVFLAACTGTKANGKTQNGKLPVLATFNAMAEFTNAVGGQKVSVTTMIPDGTEPHDFEPKVKDLAALSTAKVFVYNGLDMENWATKAISSANNRELVVVEASKGVQPIKNMEKSENGQYDPHAWMSLKSAQTEVTNIEKGLIKADPSNREYYTSNAQTYINRLQALYNTYASKFQSTSRKDFVTGHAAFAYLCRDFGLEQNSVQDVFASGEPSASKLSQLITYCRAHDVKTVFTEEMASPAVSQTLAKEVGAKVETIYTMESREDNKDYLTRLQENLDKIYASLTES